MARTGQVVSTARSTSSMFPRKVERMPPKKMFLGSISTSAHQVHRPKRPISSVHFYCRTPDIPKRSLGRWSSFNASRGRISMCPKIRACF